MQLNGNTMSKVSIEKIKPVRYMPTRHENALRLLFDPYRQQQAGWKNYKSNLMIDYSRGGVGVTQKIGITGMYVFDGQDGAESSFPSDVSDLIQDIYNTMLPLYSGIG